MKNIQLEVSLKDKTLSVDEKNRERVSLDASLFYAELFKISNGDGGKEDAYELRYRERKKGFIGDEAQRIFHFLEKEGCSSDEVQVNINPDNGAYSSITLV